jgi:hypothetical protein
MTTGTKFWLAVGTVAACFVLAAVYILKVTTPDATVLGAILGVITLIVGGYFTANAVITNNAIANTTPPVTPPKA